MKVLDLSCTHDHGFEGWFASEDDFQAQLSRGLIQCPLCGDAAIRKKLSAPRLNLGHAREETTGPATPQETPHATPSTAVALQAPDALPADAQQLQAAWMKMVRHVMANTQDVGAQFAQEARKMHYGEVQQRNIRGQATLEETQDLLEEGIAVMPLPIPDALKEPLQ